MHQAGGGGGGGGEYPWYPQQPPPPPPAAASSISTSWASAPPFTTPQDYDYSCSSYSYNNYSCYPPPVSDPPFLPPSQQPETQLHYNPTPPQQPQYPPSYPPHTHYDPPNYPHHTPSNSYVPPYDFNINNNNNNNSPNFTSTRPTSNDNDGVYAYQGKHEPYAASSKSSTWSGLFDDYGRPISFPASNQDKPVVRAVPKPDYKPDVQSGVQKFKVKLLPESGTQSTMDVICMKIDSSTFAFWSKTSVDIDPSRIRLQSNTYTTNTILDTVTAATVQFKEMGRTRPSEAPKSLELSSEKKKGLGDWITKLKPVNEEKDHWVPDEAVSKCTGCGSDFSAFNRRGRTPLTSEENAQPVRVCDRCMAEVTHRLSKAKEAASRPVTFQSHEDLAKKLQEEMEKNLRISSVAKSSGVAGSKSESSGKRMREVACPTCTVHLQVQVPSSGSETIECGVCQQPFIVSAH
ncbi:hypothetical protein KSS87_008128 [Heliosperma pusillum]|nr:hypothetical protein KSS87_008128 [Heliosperma pusillum]